MLLHGFQLPVLPYQIIHAPIQPELARNHTARHAAPVKFRYVKSFIRLDPMAGQRLNGLVNLLRQMCFVVDKNLAVKILSQHLPKGYVAAQAIVFQKVCLKEEKRSSF